MKQLSLKKQIEQATQHIVELAKASNDGYWCKEILDYNTTLPYYVISKANEKAIGILKYGV